MQLACPRDHSHLTQDGQTLYCQQDHTYPTIDGIPILLIEERQPTQWNTERTLNLAHGGSHSWPLPESWKPDSTNAVHPHVQDMIGATSGHLYKYLHGDLPEYPIPELRLPPASSATLLDIGCNWGRWSIAAARKGYAVTGIDPDINGVMTARDIAKQLGLQIQFVVGDARYLPFANNSFDVCFSYSVIQHFSKENARAALREVGRVLEASGKSLIQMPNRFGIRSLYHLSRRGFAEGEHFDVRYWTPGELREAFVEAIGRSTLSVDGFFGLGIQPADVHLMPRKYRAVVHASEFLRSLSSTLTPLLNVADSLYISSFKERNG